MRTILRLTLLGIFAAIGLGLAVAVVLHLPAQTDLAKVTELPAPSTGEFTPVALAVDTSHPPAAATSDHSKSDVEHMRSALEQTLDRWTASYLPAMTEQFDKLKEAEEAVKKYSQRAQESAEQVERLQSELPARFRNQADRGPNNRQPGGGGGEPGSGASEVGIDAATAGERGNGENVVTPAPSGVAVPPEVQRDAATDSVSVQAPNSDIRDVLKTLSDATGSNILATPSVTGNVSVSLNHVKIDEALSAILKSNGFSSRRERNFIYVGTTEEIQRLSTSDDEVGTRVYRPNYVTASELQKLFTPMLSKDAGMIAISTASEVGITSTTDKAGGDSYAGGEVLLVRDYDTLLKQMDEIFEEVDRMPSQVSIEAMILSVRLDDQNTLGVDFELLRNQNHIRLVSGGTANSLAQLNFADGLKVGFLDESLFAFINALETIGDTHVVASPHVMCLNKQRAEILIGSELGYVSTTVTETAATQSVEFLEVGTHLKLRPFISGDGMVRLEIHPELSTGTVRVQGGFTLPDKEVTQVTTNIMCRSGATVILGGLIREDLVTNSTQIPVLGNLPLLGTLFRQRVEDTERREVIVLLTPRIVTEPEVYEEAAELATQSRDRRNAFYDKMQPTNKRQLGERYHRLAVAAWTAGDADVALKNANLAIHYDPLHQSAINLRQEILSLDPTMERGVREHLRYGLRPWEHPSRDYSAETCWPWRELAPIGPPPVFTEPDLPTGHSGPVRAIITDADAEDAPSPPSARKANAK